MIAPVFVIVNTLLVSLKWCFSLVKMKVTQSCPTLCHPMDSTVHGILQARILEWVAFPNPGIKALPTALQARFLTTGPPGKSTHYLLSFLQRAQNFAIHSSILAWRIPWTVESMELQRVGHNWATFTFTGRPRIKNLPSNEGNIKSS